jgi:ABC-type antimicrobial peptide transport system permease subunit
VPAAAKTPPVWRTMLTDSLGLVAVVWAIPVAILLVGSPIVLAVALVIALVRMFQG